MTGLKDLKQTKDYPETFDVVVEIPEGSHNKLEFDADSGCIRLDRILHSPMFYPCAYGFAPGTHYLDGDPLDVCVVSSTQIPMGVIVKCRALGVLAMRDEAGVDSKILAVPVEKVDPRMREVKSIEGLPQHLRDEIALFFADYKKLEKGKFEHVKVDGWQGADEAKKILASALKK